MKIICICGLPGSGKTYLANNMISSGYKDYLLFDDIKTLEKLTFVLKENKNCIITDPWLCSKFARLRAEEFFNTFNAEVKWIFFENNPQQCLINSEKRINKPVKDLIEYLTKIYIIPEQNNINSIVKVYKE